MKRQAILIAVFVAAGFICGCAPSTKDSLKSRLRFDKVPPQHEPEITTDTDKIGDADSSEPGDDF